MPVIYLGLNRLVTYGKCKGNEPIKSIRKNILDSLIGANFMAGER